MQNHIGSFSVAKKTWANVVVVLLASAICQGSVSAQTPRLRLGTPQVLSPLGSPLQVRLPIDVSDIDEPVSSSRFSLGARPPNAAVPFIERADLTVESIGDSVELVIRTRSAIEDPTIGIVIREQLPNGVRSREFFLLLDPPSLVVVPATDRRTEVAVATLSPAAIAATPAAAPLAVNAKPSAAPEVETKNALRTHRSTPPAAAAPSHNGVGAARPTPKQLTFKAPAHSEGGPRLRLSSGGDLSSMPAATEAQRENLRARQFTLEMDDLTSVILERENRILQLEKELASLAARISVTESVISGSATPADVQRTANPVAAPHSTAPKPALATNLANDDEKLASVSPTSLSWLVWLSIIAVFALAVFVIWRSRSKSDAPADPIQAGDNFAKEFVADAVLHEVALSSAAVKDAPATIAASATKPRPVQEKASAAASTAADSKAFSPPEIHFELPELATATSEAIRNPLSAGQPLAGPAATAGQLPTNSPVMQKMRELQSHYTDISRLQPRMDLPSRLLRQAVTVFEQGEGEFAKRLLAFAAYSSPHSEEYWLALLELLYREKLPQEYLLNASLFHEIHTRSIHWDEVARIGYLLNPTEPLFLVASTWSHDPPVLGSWFPTNTENSASPARTDSFEFTK